MPTFVRLTDTDRITLFEEIKRKIDTWDKFFSSYKISRPMFFHYKFGRFEIPEELFLRWQKKANCYFNVEKIEKCRYVRKKLRYFDMDSRLAEILGVLNGDGHISRKEISIVGNINEVDYYKHLKKILEGKFGMNFTLIKDPRQNSFKLRTYSVDLSKALRERFGLPAGNKMGKLKIPIVVLSNREWGLAYLRGLFDTDGCFHIRRKKDPMISIASADPHYLSEVRKLFENFGFKISKGDRRIFLYNKKDIHRFFDEIKPANTKHLKKYFDYKANVQTKPF